MAQSSGLRLARDFGSSKLNGSAKVRLVLLKRLVGASWEAKKSFRLGR
jgi:hypothetical protein